MKQKKKLKTFFLGWIQQPFEGSLQLLETPWWVVSTDKYGELIHAMVRAETLEAAWDHIRRHQTYCLPPVIRLFGREYFICPFSDGHPREHWMQWEW